MFIGDLRSVTVQLLAVAAWLSCIPMLASTLGATEPKAERRTVPIFEACARLRQDDKDANWQEVLGFAKVIRDEAFQRAERSPLEREMTLANPQKLLRQPVASPGLHSLVHTLRYASSVPPGPGESYINNSAVVIGGDLIATVPPHLKRPQSVPGESWDGYISGSLVLVDGRIDTTSYIYDSIVIAAGPIRIGGYIYNSLVISVGSQGDSTIDVRDGYLNHALVVARRVNVKGGYVYRSIIYGQLDAADLRGADVRNPEDLLQVPWDVSTSAPVDP